MKKIISFLLMTLLVAAFSVTAFAAGSSDIYFDTYPSEDGEKICVDVLISAGGNPSMMQFCVSYDSNILEFSGMSIGSAFAGNSAPTVNHTEGKIYFIWDSLKPLETGGVMVHIEFVPKEEKDTSVGIDSEETFIVADENFEDVGNIEGSAEIDFAADDESESAPKPPEMTPESGSSSEPSGSESEPEKVPEKEDKETDIKSELESKAEITEDENTVWESGDEEVAVVEDGKIVPVSPGTTTITVKTEDGEKEATVEITVKEDGTIESEEIEVLKGNVPEKSSSGWIIVPILLVLIAVFAVVIKKIKSR